MDAEKPKAEQLSLPQAFLLLATNDKDGKPEVPVFALRTTVAGAILAELELIGAIALQGKHVRVTAAAPQTDFQHELELIRGKSRPHTPKQWVAILEGRTEVQRVYEGMASRGIVERVGEKRLGRFRAVRYPEKDHAPEAGLLEKIQATLSSVPTDAGPSDAAIPVAAQPDAATPVAAQPDAAIPVAAQPDAATPDAGASDAATPGSAAADAAKPGSKAPDARIRALIPLLQAAGLLGKLFPAADKSRVMEFATGHWPSLAVEDELRLIRLAEAESPTL